MDVLIANQENTYQRQVLLPAIMKYNDRPMVGLIPTDFDGDAEMDLLVLRKSGNYIEMHVHWGMDNATVGK